MYTVPLPDPLYVAAQRVAAASGRSVETYVLEALALKLEEDAPIQLTSEQVARIANAEVEIDAGNFSTLDEVREYFNKKQSAWTQNNPA